VSRLIRKISYQGLKDYQVYLEDKDNLIFNVKNVPTVFPQGKSYFLILGSKYLRQGSDVLIEILDSRGNTVYYEIPYYLEATGRAVSVWIYNNVTPGFAQVTVIGELENVPSDWKNIPNVKYQFNIFLNPQAVNDQPIKFNNVPDVNALYLEKKYITYVTDKTELVSYTTGSAQGSYINPTTYLITLNGGTVDRSFLSGSFYASNLKIGNTTVTQSFSASIVGILNDRQFYVRPSVYLTSRFVYQDESAE
jgi:hypothetical protein